MQLFSVKKISEGIIDGGGSKSVESVVGVEALLLLFFILLSIYFIPLLWFKRFYYPIVRQTGDLSRHKGEQ